MEIMIRIKKGNQTLEIHEANWAKGLHKQWGWVEDKIVAPPKTDSPKVEEVVEASPAIKATIKAEKEPLNVPQETEIDYFEFTKKELIQKIVDAGGKKPKPQLNKTALVEIVSNL